MGKPRPDTTRSLLTAELVACVDGPLAAQWFHLADWRDRVASAKATQRPGEPPAPALLYGQPVRGDLVDHPQYDGVVGMAVRVKRES